MATILAYYSYRQNTFRVSTATTLGTTWTPRPYLRVESLTLVAGPDIDHCAMTYLTGQFAAREADEFGGAAVVSPTWYDALDISRYFVKVELLDQTNLTAGAPTVLLTWYGVVEVDEREESQQANDDTHRTGRQTLTAFGLARLLETTLIDSAYVKKPQGSTFQTVGRGLPFNFNSRGALLRRGNRTSGKDQGVYVFDFLPAADDDPDTEDVFWNASDAVQYLLKHHRPLDAYDVPLCEWVAEPLVSGDLPLTFYDVTVETDRRSVKAVLDDLIDRRRMVGYWVYGREQSGSVNDFQAVVKVFTFTADDIPLETGSIPANADSESLFAGASPIVQAVRVRRNATYRFDELIVEGAPITTTATYHVGANAAGVTELAEGWTATQETAYKAGDSSTDELNTAARARDDMRDVFARFLVDTDWPGTVAHDLGGGDVEEFFVCLSEEVTIPDDVDDAAVHDLFLKGSDDTRRGTLAFHGKGFLELLPLRDDNTNESRRAFVALAEGDVGAPEEQYAFCEHISALGVSRTFNCNLYLLQDRLGIRIEVDKPGGQQLIAKAAWTSVGQTPNDLDPDLAEGVNYENLLLTATLEWDRRVQVKTTLGTATGHKRTLRIMIPDARLDFVLPGTVTDLQTDATLLTSDGQVVNDHRARLRDIAAAAAAWYGETRQALTITYRELNPYLEIGTLLTRLWGVSDEPINTPVTGLVFHAQRGTTTIETAYADVDFAASVPRRNDRSFVKHATSRQA